MAQKVRSIKRTLREQHGIEVPFTALQAAVLTANGIDPQAPVSRSAPSQACTLTPQEWDHLVARWMGDYDVVLKKQAYKRLLKLPFLEDEARLYEDKVESDSEREALVTRDLWIHKNSEGQYIRITLDPDGELGLKNTLLWDSESVVVHFKAYLSRAEWKETASVVECNQQSITRFVRKYWGFSVNAPSAVYCGYASAGESDHKIQMTIRLTWTEWGSLLMKAYYQHILDGDTIAEWVGLHYKQDFYSCSLEQKKSWLDRYVAAINES